MNTENVGLELEKIETANGRLDPKDVVEVARDKKHPLHQFFDWNNKSAAEAWRVQQARDLIRRCKLTIVVNDVSIKIARYVRDPEKQEDVPNETGYVSVKHVSGSEEDAGAILKYALETAAGHIRRYRHLAIAFELDNEINSILTDIERVSKSL